MDIELQFTLVGSWTLLICLIGAVFSVRHFLFYRKHPSSLSRKIRLIFLTDGFIYMVTMIFGTLAMIGAAQEYFLSAHWVRVPIILLNIVASYSLYRHYRLYTQTKE